MSQKISILILLIYTIFFTSCRKVIDVSVNPTASQYVVQANVIDDTGGHIVYISRTIGLNETNAFPKVSGATVVLQDVTANILDTLRESNPGQYIAYRLIGVPTHTYKLWVKANGSEFTAISTMPKHVPLDSIYMERAPIGNGLVLNIVYTDPPELGNNYHLTQSVNDSLLSDILSTTDEVDNGNVVSRPIFSDYKYSRGDSLTVTLEAIDKNVLTYYEGLEQVADQNSATPANPKTNITGGAIGYFSAHTNSTKILIVR